MQIAVVPLITPVTGRGFTVTANPLRALPQVLVTWKDIVAVPALIPVTFPVSTLATVVSVDVQLVEVPPAEVAVNNTVDPSQIGEVPVIVPAVGMVITVTGTTV
jgi:hypothetical protein